MEAIDNIMFNKTLNNSYNVFAQNRVHSMRRLNAYDTELFEENPIKSIEIAGYTPEQKIKKLDAELKKIDEKIDNATRMNEEILVKDLHIERFKIIQQIDALKENAEIFNPNTPYGQLVTFATNCIKKTSEKKEFFGNLIHNKIFTKLLKPLAKSQRLRELNQKLTQLNQNVDELANLSVPYGEQERKYSQLAQYLTEANSLQSSINKEIN